MSEESRPVAQDSPASPATPATPAMPATDPNASWDEPRIVVFLIGICLLIEGGLIYYQAGMNQIIIAAITGVSGITLLLFAWLVPLEEEQEPSEARTEAPAETPAIAAPPAPPIEIPPAPAQPVPVTKGAEPVPIPGAKEAQVPPSVAPSIPEVRPSEPVSPSAPPSVAAPKPIEEEEPQLSWFERLRRGLRKTRESFVGKLKKLVFGQPTIDADFLEELEGTLFEGDLGVKTTQELLAQLHKRVETDGVKDPQAIYGMLREQLNSRLAKLSAEMKFNSGGLTIFLVLGVNGVGKTTTIAKLARRYIKEGKKVLLAAGDTFRAAAIDQLSIWGERVGAEVIKGAEGGDPGALVFDAIHAAKKRQADLLIVDTAGRMHVKVNLMDELKKVKKIIDKENEGGVQEVLLVLDSTTGQNAVQQATLFNEAISVTGIIMTKLDGTSKGGVLFAVEEQTGAPVKFIGVGEKMDDLLPFDPARFLEALFEDDSDKTKKSDYKVL